MAGLTNVRKARPVPALPVPLAGAQPRMLHLLRTKQSVCLTPPAGCVTSFKPPEQGDRLVTQTRKKVFRPLPEQERLRSSLDYDPLSGALTWKHRPERSLSWNARLAGKPAFTHVGNRGYRVGCIDGVRRLAHRVVFKLVHGIEPPEIDHVDHNRANNTLTNLRASTKSQNMKNQKRRITNTSGVTGVFWHKATGRWTARVTEGGKHYHLGYFDDIANAEKARCAKARELGFDERHGL